MGVGFKSIGRAGTWLPALLFPPASESVRFIPDGKDLRLPGPDRSGIPALRSIPRLRPECPARNGRCRFGRVR